MKPSTKKPGSRLAVLLGGLLLIGLGGLAAQGRPFIRGDITGETCVDAVDAERLFEWLENPLEPLPCMDAADANNDNNVNVADAIYILQFAEQGGPPPFLPFPACGLDEDDSLGCEFYPESSCLAPPCHADPVRFVRGDASDDAGLDISDAIFILLFLFNAGFEPHCMDAADANDDGDVNVSDAIVLLHFLFLPGGSVPPPPGTECGIDPTVDKYVDCVYTHCGR